MSDNIFELTISSDGDISKIGFETLLEAQKYVIRNYTFDKPVLHDWNYFEGITNEYIIKKISLNLSKSQEG